MQIILRVIKRTILMGALAFVAGLAAAHQKLPQKVCISDGRFIVADKNILYVTSRDRASRQRIQLSQALGSEISKTSSIVFPARNSLKIDGYQYVMLVVNQSSSNNPGGYCGAGDESKLYVLKVGNASAQVVFSKLVQSCLKNIDLSDNGVDSPFSSIAWGDNPAGIRISWMRDENGGESMKFYRYLNGGFE